MMDKLFEAEVESLISRGYTLDLPTMQSIGYRHMGNFMTGAWDLEMATNMLIRDTRRYAKRQSTWFRRYHEMRWHENTAGNSDAILREIDVFLKKKSQ